VKPTLAAATDGTNLRYPLLASPKLDGVRAININGILLSRSLKLIPNKHIQMLFGRREFHGLDGELIIGDPTAKNVCNVTTSGVMSREGTPPTRFYVFDDHTHVGTFKYRHKGLHARIAGWGSVMVVKHSVITNEQELLRYETDMLALGYEGIMIRDPNGYYKHGRSTLKEGLLLKLKRFEDSEAEVLGVVELMTNLNGAMRNALGHLERSRAKAGLVGAGTLGALQVRDLTTGVEFEIGTGFNQHDRELLWSTRNDLPGRLVRYKYQPTGVKEKPRFPVFLGFRDPRDL